MYKPKIALVVPTLRKLECWRSYALNFKKFGHDIGNVKLFAVDDYGRHVKENMQLLAQCEVPFEFWTVSEQRAFFRRHFGRSWKRYWQVIPHHTDACRSFGYIVAGNWGADIIVTFDDDNWCIDALDRRYDYLAGHSVVGRTLTLPEMKSSTSWLNTCSLLNAEPSRRLWARGFPYSRRGEEYEIRSSTGAVAMNVGLWLGCPDVDAMTILAEGAMNGIPKTKTTALNQRDRIILAEGTFAPLNTANTAYSSRLLPCIYDTFQGVRVSGLKLDRFGDIWCNLFLKKLLDSAGEKVTIGIPLVEHRREPRPTLVDLEKEFWGVLVSESLIQLVENLHIEKASYADMYLDLIEQLDNQEIHPNTYVRKYFRHLFRSMREWLAILEKLGLM